MSRRSIDWALVLEQKLQGLERKREGFHLGPGVRAAELRLEWTQALERRKWRSSRTCKSGQNFSQFFNVSPFCLLLYIYKLSNFLTYIKGNFILND